MNWYKMAKQEFVMENIHIDYSYGQNEYALVAKIPSTQDIIGEIDYSEFEGGLFIKFINVKQEYRRQGIATSLIKELEKLNQTEFENKPINWGMLTEEGSALKESL